MPEPTPTAPGGAGAALACTVRGCGLALERAGRQLRCARGHAFDRARSGYVNLLQPQDRRSRAAGDACGALEARARLAAAGFGAELARVLAAELARLELERGAVALDLGSGGGELLAELARKASLVAIGIDLSAAAAEHAARRFPELTWIVANADRRLPLLDGSVQLVLSLHGRRNPHECARVLAPGGHLLAALPAADDLLELRARVQGAAREHERASAFLTEHEAGFELVRRARASTRRSCTLPELADLLRGTYRGERAAQAPAVAALEEMEVTLASDVLLLARREGPAT